MQLATPAHSTSVPTPVSDIISCGVAAANLILTFRVVQDVLVLMQCPVQPLSLCRAKTIGALRMVDAGEQDDKIIAVCADDPAYKHYNDISELPAHRWKEIRSFFLTYKRGQLEEKYGKHVEINIKEGAVFGVADPFKDQPLSPKKGVTVDEDMISAEEAKRIIVDAQRLYQEDKKAKAEKQ
jgi:inorganic pyrophosphatase